jgi:DNA adenine methylase
MQYFGGKQKIAKYIADFINATHTHTHYVEPFCGSCNVASKINIENKILNDKHTYLIAMFIALQDGWIPPEIITEDEYNHIKANPNENKKLSGFVGFGCSFAGKWFECYARNKEGRNYCKNAHNSILKKIKLLQDAKFTCCDFINLDFKNSIIYCDPPYKGTGCYNKQLLGDFPYDDFIDWVKIQSKNNIVLVSEYKHNVPNDARIVLEINSRTDMRGINGQIPTIEVLYTYNK